MEPETPPDSVVRGIKAVADALGCSERTAYALARRPVDPLRLWSAEHDPTPWQVRSRLAAFRRRWQTPDHPELAASRVTGWLPIARLLGMSVDLAQRLAIRAADPLPVQYTKTRRVYGYREALLDWLDGQHRPHVQRTELVSAKRRRLRGEARSSNPKAKGAKLLRSAESRATGTTRVGVAREHEDHRSQVESAASSRLRLRPLRSNLRSACSRPGGTMRVEL